MWNPFKKSNSNNPQKMGMLQRIAMKKMQNMSQDERDKILNDALKPENRDKLLRAMEKMQSSGQLSKHQMEMAKKRLGL